MMEQGDHLSESSRMCSVRLDGGTTDTGNDLQLPRVYPLRPEFANATWRALEFSSNKVAVQVGILFPPGYIFPVLINGAV